jgi:putative tryptophan/tyrosine transport system substrate-binding protein
MRRRKFITLLGGAAAAWPLAARAQQRERMRRIGVLAQGAANDPQTAANLTAFVQGLQELGWTVGRNARIEYRWADGDATLVRKHAAELVALAPDVILAAGGNGMRPCSTSPALFRSCSMPSTRWPPASSIAWRGPAVTPLDFLNSNSP